MCQTLVGHFLLKPSSDSGKRIQIPVWMFPKYKSKVHICRH